MSALSGPAAARERDVVDRLEELYRARYPDFLRTAAAVAGGEEAGRDAVNDAFAALVRGHRRYAGRGTLEAWAWRAVVNAARKQRRRAGASVALPDDTAAGEPEPVDVAAVRRAVARLPERQRLVLFLRYYGDLDYAAIAAVLGIRTGTVGAALHAALKTLRTSLEEVRP